MGIYRRTRGTSLRDRFNVNLSVNSSHSDRNFHPPPPTTNSPTNHQPYPLDLFHTERTIRARVGSRAIACEHACVLALKKRTFTFHSPKKIAEWIAHVSINVIYARRCTRRYYSLPFEYNLLWICPHARTNIILFFLFFFFFSTFEYNITLSRLCAVLRVCVHRFFVFVLPREGNECSSAWRSAGPNAFVTRSTRMRQGGEGGGRGGGGGGGLSSANRRSTLAVSPANVESSNWDTVLSVLGGFLSVSIRLDAYLWNTCGARRPSVLASSISGCTCICAPDRRPLCTAYRPRRSVEPANSRQSPRYFKLELELRRRVTNVSRIFLTEAKATPLTREQSVKSYVPCAVSSSVADNKSCHNYPNTWQVSLVVDSDIRSRCNTLWCALCDTSVLQQQTHLRVNFSSSLSFISQRVLDARFDEIGNSRERKKFR